jgi:hypothetical protein
MGQEDHEAPESFRSALAVIRDLRERLRQSQERWEWQRDETVCLQRANDDHVPLLDALRSADLQVLPEHIAKLVAEWKAS